ncbi:MAG TPA: hypothetical protein VKB50_24945 [Vicinamibacterales bacterium]|nr:hypothetical protein [Vicinamibacterales bacterium]
MAQASHARRQDERQDNRQSDRRDNRHSQLALYRRAPRIARRAPQVPLCAGCRAREARYGFRDEAEPLAQRPRTLCFDCFRMEINHRQDVAAHRARGWDAQQVRLPLDETLDALTKRRRRAQIAARHALESAR